jgi:hypothetical protein
VSDEPFAGLAFAGEWRRYQRHALQAFERDRAGGRTHLVAPPGSGKTVLGVELVRRLGRRALVLVPSAATQAAWLRGVRMFVTRPADAPRVAGAHPAAPLACLTYASLCGLEDPEIALERAEGSVSLGDLVSSAALARVAHLRAAGVGTVVLDDCHALASPWGSLVRAVLAELGDDLHVIGLTATPPGEVSADYEELLGPVGFTIPTPAVVRDGHLAPYQELAWLTEPLEVERQWLETSDTDADRLLERSAAKAAGAVDVLAAERESRGQGLRAVVLCDAESAEPRVDDPLGGVLDPAAITARQLLMAIAADPRIAALRPLLVSARGLLCVPGDAESLVAALASAARERYALPEWEAEADGVLCSLRSSGAEWVAGAWLDLATRLLEDGVVGVLVGTGELLGSGWEPPGLNCLVDLTVSSAGASMQQIRGRTLLLDPADRAKLASNWDVVCVAPGGGADYERFVRRHEELYAPAEDGAIERGVPHVHPELGAAAPPAAALRAINAATIARAAARDETRARWRVGAPYRGEELRTLLLRRSASSPAAAPSPRHGAGAPPPAAAPSPRHGAGAPPPAATPSSRRGAGAPPVSQRLPIGAGVGGAASFAAAALAAGAPALLAGVALAPAGLACAAWRLRAARERLPVVLPLDRAARAVADAYRELGEVSAEAAASVELAPRAAGWVRCALPAATPEESERVVTALGELLGDGNSRSFVTRPVAQPGVSTAALLGRVLRRREPFGADLHPVPSDLARDPDRTAAFLHAWSRAVGPGRLVDGHESRRAGEWEAVVSDVWV